MSTSTTKTAIKTARSPVERAIVWTVIGIGLLVVLLESKAYFAHASALGSLQTRLKEANEGETDQGMTKADVDKIIGGREPDESNPLTAGETAMGAARLDVYGFKGLMRNRQVYVYYGIAGKQNQDAEVMEVSTGPTETLAAAMAKLPPPTPGVANESGSGAGTPPGPGGMRPGAEGEGPGAPGRRGRGGAGGPGAGGPGRGGRPPVEGEETSTEAKKGAESKAKGEEKAPALESTEEKPDAPAAPEAKAPEAKADAEASPEAAKSEEKKDE